MSSEAAAGQAAQQRHHHNMAFGKKQRYIEVFQCSGEDMNHVLTGGGAGASAAAAAAASSAVHASASGQTANGAAQLAAAAAAHAHSHTVKTSNTSTPTAGNNGPAVHTAAAGATQNTVQAAVAAANGLMPPGMFTTTPCTTAHTAFGHTAAGLDPNSTSLFHAAQITQPFLQFVPASQPNPNVRTGSADMVNLQAAGLFGLAPPAAAQILARPPANHATSAAALMAAHAHAYNPIAAQMQQQQLFAQQQQLLQHQLAAQRLLLSNPAAPGAHSAQPGLIGPRPPPPPPPSQSTPAQFVAAAHAHAAHAAAKRSFDQAFTASQPANGQPGLIGPTDPSKRPAYATPTISAGPTTYHSR